MPPPQDNARFILLIMMILWLNTSNDATIGILSAPSMVQERVGRQRMAYDAMQRSAWGDFAPQPQASEDAGAGAGGAGGRYLNITGFRHDDGLAWDDLARFRDRCLASSRAAYPVINGRSLWDSGQTMMTWQNATGSVSGPWLREAVSVQRFATSYNMSAISSLSFKGGGRQGYGALPSGSDAAAGAGSDDASRLQGRGVGDESTEAEAGGAAGSGSSDEADAGQADAGQADAGQADEHASGRQEEHDSRDAHSARDGDARARAMAMQPGEWGRNVTGGAGKLIVRITDLDDEAYTDGDAATAMAEPRSGGLVRATTATVTVEDVEGTGSSYDMRLHGVHWPQQGTLLLATTSEKFGGIFALPHLAPTRSLFESSKALLARTLNASLREREAARPFGPDAALSTPLWSSNVDGAPEGLTPLPRCEYVMYMQIHPLDESQFLPRAARGVSGASEASEASERRRDVADGSETRMGAGDDDDDTVHSNANANATALDARHLPSAYDYGQADMTQLMRRIEHELRFPTGAPIFPRGVPELHMSAVLYSPDCAYMLETKGPPRVAPVEGQHLRGRKVEEFLYEARLWLLALAAVFFAQIRLFLAQVRQTYTPSTLGRVSLLTMAAMVLADGLVFSAASAWTLTASSSFLPALVVTFAAFTSMLIGGHFLSEIYAAQEPERRRRDREQMLLFQQQQMAVRERLRQHYASSAAVASASASAAAPARARADSVPVIVPSDQDIDAEIADNARIAATPLLPTPVTVPTTAPAAGAATAAADLPLPPSQPFASMALRMGVVGVVILFFSLAASTWWAALRTVYTNLLAWLYLSMWVPQIVRNVQRNSRRAFSWPFMVGQSVLRLLPLAYFYLRSDNILFAETDWRAFAVLAAWVWLQLWVLAAQHALGPRFGLPAGWLPEAWEYHPVLREDSVEAARLPIGLVSTVSTASTVASTASVVSPKRRLSSSTPTSAAAAASAASASAVLPNTNLWTVDCAICCETLNVPVVRAGVDDPTAGGVAGVLERRKYMVTPCRHIFHTECLEGWLRFRLQCPICREELPPL